MGRKGGGGDGADVGVVEPGVGGEGETVVFEGGRDGEGDGSGVVGGGVGGKVAAGSAVEFEL